MADLIRKADGELVLDQDLGNHFDDLFDDLHANKSLGDADAGTHTADEEEVKRWEQQFLAGVSQEVNSRLASSGMRVIKAQVDMTDGNSYLFVISDRYRRRFDVSLEVENALSMTVEFGENTGREIIDLVTKQALTKRDEYFRRML